MGVLFTAIRVRLSGECLQLGVEGGMALISDPVSTRKRVPVCVSL